MVNSLVNDSHLFSNPDGIFTGYISALVRSLHIIGRFIRRTERLGRSTFGWNVGTLSGVSTSSLDDDFGLSGTFVRLCFCALSPSTGKSDTVEEVLCCGVFITDVRSTIVPCS